MSLSWEEELRLRTRRRRVRVGLVALLVVVVAVIATQPRPYRGDPPLEATAGYTDDTQVINTAPFQLPESNVRGSTTLLVPDTDDPYATTTTSAPPVTLPPEGTFPHDDHICAGINELYQFSRRSGGYYTEGTVKAEAIAAYQRAVAQLRLAGDPSLAKGIALFDSWIEELKSATSDDQAIEIISELTEQTSAEVRAATALVLAHAQGRCPDLIWTTPH